MRLLSLFSGIGAFEKALCNLKIPFELVNYCEFDKYASKSYSLIHGVSEDKNLGDITKVDETTLPDDIDILTYGFPCQDISLAGNQQGLFNTDGTRTRSGLFFDALRIINHTSPKIAIAENVKNLASKKFEEQFNIVLQSLAQSGGGTTTIGEFLIPKIMVCHKIGKGSSLSAFARMLTQGGLNSLNRTH